MPLPKLDDEMESSVHSHGHCKLQFNHIETDFDASLEYYDSCEVHSVVSVSFSDAEHHEAWSRNGEFVGDNFTTHEDSHSLFPRQPAPEKQEEYSTLFPKRTFEESWLPFHAATSLFYYSAPTFEGLIIQAAHILYRHTMCFNMVGIEQQFHSAEASSNAAFSMPTTSLSLYGPVRNPWDTLEQPSMMHAFGRLNGTTTLSRQVDALSPAMPLTKIVPRASAKYLDSGLKTGRLMSPQSRGFRQNMSRRLSLQTVRFWANVDWVSHNRSLDIYTSICSVNRPLQQMRASTS